MKRRFKWMTGAAVAVLGVSAAIAGTTMAQASENGTASAASSGAGFQFCSSFRTVGNHIQGNYNIYYKISGTLYDGQNFPQRTTLHTNVFKPGGLGQVCVNQNDFSMASLPGGHFTIELWGVNPSSHKGVKIKTLNWASTIQGGKPRDTYYAATGTVPAAGSYKLN
jgi:hypothetical protein